MMTNNIELVKNFFLRILHAIRDGMMILGKRYAVGEINIEDIPEEYRDIIIYYSETEVQK